MGFLRDTAKKNSNFLKLEKGEEMVVTFLAARVIPSTMDPTKETVQYKLGTELGEKFWTNGNSAIMMFFDDIEPGTKIKIKRDVWLNKGGVEDPSKSSWLVEKYAENPNL